MQNRKVIVFGTFDIFHPGHKDFFEQAKKLGNYLVVVVARDKNVKNAKGALPLNNELIRLKKIQKNGFAEEIVLGNQKDIYIIIKQQHPDIVCLGYDQKVNEKELQKRLKEYKLNEVKVIRLKAFKPKIYKSSLLKNS